jgi:exodeoxyribonuclease V alpha subunit
VIDSIKIKESIIRKYSIAKEIAGDLVEDYLENSIEIIEKKGYLLGQYDIEFKEIENIINKYSNNIDKEVDLIKASIVYAIEDDAKNNGNVFMHFNIFEKKVKKLLAKKVSKEKFNKALDELKNESEIIIENDCNENLCVYISRLHKVEVEFANGLAEIINNNEGINDEKIEKFIDEYDEIKLEKKQKEAIEVALKNDISIINGMAGTGKTTVIKVIIKAMKKVFGFNKIMVLGYTGKSVQRAMEVTNLEAEGNTIHRFLGIDEKGKIKRNSKIKLDVLILDESSMVDITLMNTLLSYIECSKIIFTGDYGQLPSIKEGQVFKDLILSNLIPTAKLEKIIRQKEGNIILENSKKINFGIGFQESSKGVKEKKKQFEFEECEAKDIKKKVIKTIEGLIKNDIDIYDIKVMSAIREGVNGVKDLNKKITDEFNPINGREVSKLAVLDNVMAVKNNYDKNIFNGENGIIIRTEGDNFKGLKKVNVKFGENKIVEYKDDEISELELAYATTIHKMQGSEVPVAIIIVDNEKVLSRELLYVAVSRAKERVIMIGNKGAFNNGLKVTVNRNSMLVERIQDSMKKRMA